MIPKIIHYCWFGDRKKTPKNVFWIEQWKKIFPDYEIKEWNEKNFDINQYQYTQEAYNKKKYAFVSDVARIKALYEYGGIYLDNDIEIKRDFSELLNCYKTILGYEDNGKRIMTAFIASEKKSRLMKDILKLYENEKFIKEDGTLNEYPNTYRITELLKNNGINIDGNFQIYNEEFAIFPEQYFSAMEFSTMKEISDETTYTVHHFNSSWKPWYVKIRRKVKILIFKILRNIKSFFYKRKD